MSNPISNAMKTGTIGELLVQLRLLQYGVQSAPPLKDSGNDLIGFLGDECRTIQVKTSANGDLPAWPSEHKRYNILVVVSLCGEGTELDLERTQIFAIPKSELLGLDRSWLALERFRMTNTHVARCFESHAGA